MTEITITLNKEAVYEEVSQTTSYMGTKSSEGENYDTVFTTEEDSNMLERFWNESKNTICNSIKKFILEETEVTGTYMIKLQVPDLFDKTLADSIHRSLFSYFVLSITSKWNSLFSKELGAGTMIEAAVHVDAIKRILYHRKRPVRTLAIQPYENE